MPRTLRSLTRWLIASALCVTGTNGCERREQSVQVSPNDPRIQYLGAFDQREPTAPRFAWPATEVRLTFRGTSVSAELSDAPLDDETRQTDWLAVQVDQLPMTKLALFEGKKRYELARALPPGENTIRLITRTEPEVGTITLHGLTLSAGATVRSVPRPAKRLLFVGDSITAGYGNEGANPQCPYSPSTSDAARTFASLAAQALGAEAFVSAWSGKGVMRNYEARDVSTMPTLFLRVLPGDPSSPELPRTPAPDAIVVALGTNDFLLGVPEEQAFLAAYRALLLRLDQRAKGAPVLLVLGPMLSDDHPQPHARSTLRRWLSLLKREREQAFAKVGLLEQWARPAEGLGCDFHPNLRSHARLANELSQALRKLCEW